MQAVQQHNAGGAAAQRSLAGSPNFKNSVERQFCDQLAVDARDLGVWRSDVSPVQQLVDLCSRSLCLELHPPVGKVAHEAGEAEFACFELCSSAVADALHLATNVGVNPCLQAPKVRFALGLSGR